MTIRAAADQIVSTIAAIGVTSLEASVVGNVGFAHNQKIGDEYAGTDRQFNVLVGTSGSMDGRRNGRLVEDLEILVDYLDHQNSYELGLAIAADYAAIVEALKDANNWGRPTSTICVIYPTDEVMFPYTVEDIEDEKGRSLKRLVISIAVEHLAVGAN